MKERLTAPEVDNLISMLNSSDKDTILLAFSIILSKSYKSTRQLNTAIYRARLAQREYLRHDRILDYFEGHLKACIEALERYKKKIRAV